MVNCARLQFLGDEHEAEARLALCPPAFDGETLD
jgi:hypothetical protein